MVLGSAFDILQRGWPPRTAYVDYPLGYSCGKPFDAADQRAIAASALSMLHEPLAEGGALRALNVGGWAVEEEDINLTIGGGGMVRPPHIPQPKRRFSRRVACAAGQGESGEDTRQPRDGVRRYQAAEDLAAEGGGEGGVVSPEALRQAAVKAERA